MQFYTERLLVREYLDSDVHTVHAYGSDAEVTKYEVWGPNTEEESRAFVGQAMKEQFEPERWAFNLAVCFRDSGMHIGGCSIRRESERSRVGSLGWIIDPRYQGRGYATEAARALIDIGFVELGLSVIFATCDTRNTASFRVMEKLGMVRVGELRSGREIKGHRRAIYRYEVVR